MTRIRIDYLPLVAILLFMFIPPESIKAQATGVGISGSYSAGSHINNFQLVRGGTELDFSPSFASGFNAGLIYRANFSRNVRLQVEPSLALLGAQYSDTFQYQGHQFQTDSRTSLSYVQLPLLIQITTAPPQRSVYGIQFTETTYHFTAGLYGGYLLNAQFSGTNSGAHEGAEFQGKFSDNISDQYFDFDAGTVLGGGFETGHSTKFGFEARFMLGVLSPDDPNRVAFDPSNMAITVGAYLVF